MRHIVRKSKVHTINKLSREAKKLKAKKGSEEQIVKNKNKAERFVNELMVIKVLLFLYYFNYLISRHVNIFIEIIFLF
jgi:hypothetical protein